MNTILKSIKPKLKINKKNNINSKVTESSKTVTKTKSKFNKNEIESFKVYSSRKVSENGNIKIKSDSKIQKTKNKNFSTNCLDFITKTPVKNNYLKAIELLKTTPQNDYFRNTIVIDQNGNNNLNLLNLIQLKNESRNNQNDLFVKSPENTLFNESKKENKNLKEQKINLKNFKNKIYSNILMAENHDSSIDSSSDDQFYKKVLDDSFLNNLSFLSNNDFLNDENTTDDLSEGLYFDDISLNKIKTSKYEAFKKIKS